MGASDIERLLREVKLFVCPGEFGAYMNLRCTLTSLLSASFSSLPTEICAGALIILLC